MHHHQQFLGSGAEAVGVVLRLEIGRGVQRLAGRRGEDEARVRHPVVDPAPVRALEVALGRARAEDPAVEHRRLGLLGALPHAAAANQRALQQRSLDPLPATRDLACAQRRADRGAGGEERAEAGPVRGGKHRSRARGSLHPFIGDLELGEGIRSPAHVVDRALGPAALLEVQPGARGHERIVAGAIRMRLPRPYAVIEQ